MVMKKTRTKHLLRTIRKTGVTFVATAIIACVSIAIYVGFQSTAEAILNRADRYFKENRFETLEIACANGITPGDIEAISAWEGVDAVEGGYTASVSVDLGEEKVLVQARSLLSGINTPVVVEGTLPAAPDEVAIEEIMASGLGLSVGDEITLAHDGCLTSDTFRITAVINEPSYCYAMFKDARGFGTAGTGSNEYYLSLPLEAFDASYYEDCFTAAYLISDELAGLFYFSDAYESLEAGLMERFQPLAEERAELRYTQLSDEAATKLSDAQADIDAAEGEILDAKAEIADNEAAIADSEQEIADGEQALADGQAALEDARGEIAAQLSALGLDADFSAALSQLEALGQAGAPLRAAIEAYQANETSLAASREELEAARAELSDGKARLEEAQAEVSDAEAELADAKTAFSEAEADAAALEKQDWILSGRSDVGDVRSIGDVVDALNGLSLSMSAVFLLVACVVCFAAITRMINEQITLIGAQKALGFTTREILTHYMRYNALCALLGAVLGWAVAVVVVENLVLDIFIPSFLIGPIPLAFSWSSGLLSAAICLVVFLLSGYAACKRLVRLPATTLLRGELPASTRAHRFEKWRGYQRLSLYTRTIIKNLLSDKGRVMTTIVGVVGSISLLMICLSMKLSMDNTPAYQFEHYFFYENRLVVDSAEGDVNAFAQALDQQGVSYTLVQDKLRAFRVDGGEWESVHVLAPDDPEALDAFMRLEDAATGQPVEAPEEGLLVSRRSAEIYGLTAGSTVELMDEDGRGVSATVAGVIEHYLPYHLFVTSQAYYASVLGEDADPCVFLLKGDISGLAGKVETMPGFMALKDNGDYMKSPVDLNTVIIVCLIMSVVMAVLVLLNQAVLQISRKARELTVMRINGYTLGETKSFVGKDNVLLTVIGLLLGCAIGIGLAYVVIRVVEIGVLHYLRFPSWTACAVSCVTGAVLSLAVNLIALRRIDHLNLTNVSSN